MLHDQLRAICFDIGGVVVSMPRGTLATELATILKIDEEQIRALLIEHAKRRRTNIRTLAAVLTSFSGSPNRDRIEAAIRRRTVDMETPELYPDAVPKLRQLATDGWRICFLTNAIGIEEAKIPPAYYSLAELVVHSWEIGACKPDIAAFRAVERRMGLGPQQLVKVGDSLRSDIAGARNAGWSAVHINRAGSSTPTTSEHTISSLCELPALSPAGTPPACPGDEP